MKLRVGEQKIVADSKQEALMIASEILRVGHADDRVILRTLDKGVYGWVQYCQGINDKKRYAVCFTKASNVGRTIILPDCKLSRGTRWTKPRERPQKQ